MIPRFLFPALTTALLLATPPQAGEYFGISTGLTVSKSILGLAYARDQDEINFGLKSFSFTSGGEYLLAPGISYNRIFNASGYFATVTYAPLYFKPATSGGTASRPPAFGSGQPSIREGWNRGELYFGAGKTFRFSPEGSWGIDADANLYTPVSAGFLKAWYYRIGAGVSYRFALD